MTPADIDNAVNSLTKIIQGACDLANTIKKMQPFSVKLTAHVKFVITEKNLLRRIYLNTCERCFKTAINSVRKEIKEEIAEL